ncbi:glycosyltransferase [Arthrobacter koreensis]|uniref:glycosyltransferase n=1 Tax=Arthrobacter koreensis TaxID=199136 RepID=UPI0036DD0566
MEVDVSVVIGFKNWGLNRLRLAVTSIQESFGALRGEVIVSDYGSDEWEETKTLMEGLGARYVYTETDGTWSRSRALNAGFAVSKGRVLISTDADMVFSPRAMETIGTIILKDPTLCVLLQCRDLPEQWSDAQIAEHGPQWSVFEEVSRLRPRWGMGGMMAVPREAYIRIRGLDERMHTYGGEDIDFATRARRAGQRLLWLETPDARMYHMWHPSTRAVLKSSAGAEEAIAANKKIVYEDQTFVRNTPRWSYRPIDAPPLVTVAISTYNRADYLSESIYSVLAQTMQDFEIIIVDDGSSDNTKDVVASFNDERIRYIYQENSGISAARNRAADEARGLYTAVLDDDDLMTPWRLEKHFEHLTLGSHGTFGSFVNFDNSTGEMKLYASKRLNSGTVHQTGGAPGHGTWMVETDLLRKLRYDETLSSGVDNNMALRLVRSGAVLHHTGEIMMMRRMHSGQITWAEEDLQKDSAQQTRHMFSYSTTKWGGEKLNAERGPGDYVPVRHQKQLDVLVPYLPDHLVHRTVYFDAPYDETISLLSKSELGNLTLVEEYAEDGSRVRLTGLIRMASLKDLAVLARMSDIAYDIEAVAHEKSSAPSLEVNSTSMFSKALHNSLRKFGRDSGEDLGWVAALRPDASGAGHDCFGPKTVRSFVVNGNRMAVTYVSGGSVEELKALIAAAYGRMIAVITDMPIDWMTETTEVSKAHGVGANA